MCSVYTNFGCLFSKCRKIYNNNETFTRNSRCYLKTYTHTHARTHTHTHTHTNTHTYIYKYL